MTTRDLIEALSDATRDEMREIRRLLGVNARDRLMRGQTLVEMGSGGSTKGEQIGDFEPPVGDEIPLEARK